MAVILFAAMLMYRSVVTVVVLF